MQPWSVFVWKPGILQGAVLSLLQLFLSLWLSQQGRSWHHPGNLHVISLRKHDSLSIFHLIFGTLESVFWRQMQVCCSEILSPNCLAATP